jgi:hypothetical protein
MYSPNKNGLEGETVGSRTIGCNLPIEGKKKKKTEFRYSNVDNIGKPKSIDYEMFGWTQ